MDFPFSAGLLDSCVLAIVEKENAYGYILTQKMKEKMDISESTLYPVLRRLQKEDFLQTYDEPFQGRNRRYYAITDKGKERLVEYKASWVEYKTNIEDILFGGECIE
ncbi:MAG: PadR family transcriptional regulator [Clostridiales bacterium]